MIYFISDTHFNHKNIIKYCNRPFESVNQMNKTIVVNWNAIILPTDIVYHIGDFALGNKELSLSIIDDLSGNKFLLRGNHDKWSTTDYEKHGFNVLKDTPIKLDKYKLILSHVPLPDKQIPEGYINLHGHIHNKNLYDCFEKYDPCDYSLEKHINLSCDVTDFKPVSIYQILNS